MANSFVIVMTTCVIKNFEGMQPNLCRNYRVPNHRS